MILGLFRRGLVGTYVIFEVMFISHTYHVSPSFYLTFMDLKVFPLSCVVVQPIGDPNQFSTSRASKIGMIRRPCLALFRLT